MNEEIFKSLTAGDLQYYYGKTYLRVKTPKAKDFVWSFISDFNSESPTKIQVNLLPGFSEEEPGNQVHRVADCEWDFEKPDSGVYNFRNSVIVFSKRPYRCTTKAISKHTAQFSNLMAPLQRLKLIPQEMYLEHDFQWTAAHMEELFTKNKTTSFDKALEKIVKHQCFAVSLNRKISLSQGVMSEYPAIWLKERLIGELNPVKRIVYPVHDSWIPELKQTFHKENVAVKGAL